jgi:hypothetical protein
MSPSGEVSTEFTLASLHWLRGRCRDAAQWQVRRTVRRPRDRDTVIRGHSLKSAFGINDRTEGLPSPTARPGVISRCFRPSKLNTPLGDVSITLHRELPGPGQIGPSRKETRGSQALRVVPSCPRAGVLSAEGQVGAGLQPGCGSGILRSIDGGPARCPVAASAEDPVGAVARGAERLPADVGRARRLDQAL